MSHRRAMLISIDLWAAVIVAGLAFVLLPRWVSLPMAKDLYGLGTSVLSIVFSVFIAALAVIISATDDAFVKWLEEENQFSDILWMFKATLVILFIALVYSVIAYAITASQAAAGNTLQHSASLVLFTFLFFYSLDATLAATMAAVGYARRRTEFVKLTH